MGEENNRVTYDRRSSDTVIDMLRSENENTRFMLNSHIQTCAAQQRWILRGLIGLCGWVVLHSPEVLGLAGKMLSEVAK
jgi:hypothetical protein